VTADPYTSIPLRGDATRDERWYLTDEQDFLRRSLDDARREREAGDLSDEDYDVLVTRDAARLAEVEAEPAEQSDPDAQRPASSGIEASDADGAPRPPMAMWRKVGIGASCLLIVLGVVILVVHFVQARQPGQAASGGI